MRSAGVVSITLTADMRAGALRPGNGAATRAGDGIAGPAPSLAAGRTWVLPGRVRQMQLIVADQPRAPNARSPIALAVAWVSMWLILTNQWVIPNRWAMASVSPLSTSMTM